MDHDYALKLEQSTPLTDESSPYERKNFEKWERSNRVSPMIMKRSTPEAFRGTKSEEINTASEYPTHIQQYFVINNKVETSTFFGKLGLNEV
jgi:hypothetical protein